MDGVRISLVCLYACCATVALAKLTQLLVCGPGALLCPKRDGGGTKAAGEGVVGGSSVVLLLIFVLIVALSADRVVRFSTCGFHDFREMPADCFLMDYAATGAFFLLYVVIFTML